MSKPEKHEFQAEIAQLLEIVIHSLYTEKEIFIRELISNAADANEKLQFLQQTAGNDIFEPERPLSIRVVTDADAKTVTITDSGIGMTQAELVENLGTIAHSGSKAFLEQIKQANGDARLIGQFGVGFYSAYLVADKVVVTSKSNDDEQYCWESAAGGTFTVAVTTEPKITRGTRYAR